MNKLLFFILLIGGWAHLSQTFAQSHQLLGSDLASAKTYYNVQKALQQKEEVLQVNIRQQSYYQLPPEIYELVNLQFINAMKNNIADISPAVEIGRASCRERVL